MPGLDEYLTGTDDKEFYLKILKYKKKMRLPKMLQAIEIINDDDAELHIKHKLLKVIQYVEKLQFQDRPDYQKIRNMVAKCQKLSVE